MSFPENALGGNSISEQTDDIVGLSKQTSAFAWRGSAFNSGTRKPKGPFSSGLAITRKSEDAGRPGPCSVVVDCAKLYPLVVIPRRSSMPQGTVKWFNPTKGYGFIQPQEGGKDVFVHISAVERAGLSTLNEGQTVQFELVENRGKTSAENLKVK